MTYLKLNNNLDHLSLGNLFNQIKKLSINKSSAIQTEIFCILFNIDNIAETTVGNYCTGYRAIGNKYRQIYINYKKHYQKDNTILLETINNLISIMEGTIKNYQKITEINNNDTLKNLTINLFNIAKNDQSISQELKEEILSNLRASNYYHAISIMLFFIILEKKQPIKSSDLITETIEELLNNTNISVNHLKKYLEVQFKEGISLVTSLKKLSEDNNPYALFELGNMEYNGLISGKPRYDLAYQYHLKSAKLNHPGSNWMIAHMILNEKLSPLGKEEIALAFTFLNKAKELNSISALNTLGLCYLTKNNPENKIDKAIAIKYFKKAIKKEYPYAYNNLGSIYEKEGKYELALSYYLKSAEEEESWACNKVGEFYRLGLGTKKDLTKAYHYYTKGATSPIKNLYPWNIYNLVTYFYLEGSLIAGVKKDLNKATELLEKIKDQDKAQELLLYVHYKKYLITKSPIDLINTQKYLNIVNNNPNINTDYKKIIESTLNNLSNKITIKSIESHKTPKK